MKKIRILHLLSALELTNGVASYVMNHYDELDHDKFKVDFLIVKTADQKYIDKIEKNKDEIIYGPKLTLKNYGAFKKHAKKIFEERTYDIVHSHEFNWGMPYLKEAKKKHIPIRIFHAHLTLSSPKRLNRIRNAFLIPISLRASNTFFSCSMVAGKYFFKQKPFYLAHNAIDTEKYMFNIEHRKDIRKLLNISDTDKLIGFFGRFEHQKNPMFTLKVFQELSQRDESVKLLLVGNGYLEQNILNFIDQMNLKDRVIVLSPRRDIYKFYSAIDLFMLPSLFEGLPVVGVEALFSNLPQVYSTEITQELNLNQMITYLDLKEPVSNWVLAIENIFEKPNDRIHFNLDNLKVYDIRHQGKVIMEKYIELLEEVNHGR